MARVARKIYSAVELFRREEAQRFTRWERGQNLPSKKRIRASLQSDQSRVFADANHY